MHEINTSARQPILYKHHWTGDEKIKKGKGKGTYPSGTVEFRLLPDVEGIVPWIALDPTTGRPTPLTVENFEEFLVLVIHDDDAHVLVEALEAGTFKQAARYDCAMSAWKNACGETDYLSAAAKVHLLHLELERLAKVAEEAQEVITNAEKVRADVEAAGEAEVENTAPLDD